MGNKIHSTISRRTLFLVLFNVLSPVYDRSALPKTSELVFLSYVDQFSVFATINLALMCSAPSTQKRKRLREYAEGLECLLLFLSALDRFTAHCRVLWSGNRMGTWFHIIDFSRRTKVNSWKICHLTYL